jgi:hypothetical protein
MSSNANSHIELVGCPQCAATAEIVDRFDLPSTGGDVQHVTVQCVVRHRFTMSVDHLTAPAATAAMTGTEPGR